MDNNEKEFIKELEQLSRKYKLKIGGCGCCGSPSIDPLKEAESGEEAGYNYDDQLMWVSLDYKYHWDQFKPVK